jgi:hypothetical protein
MYKSLKCGVEYVKVARCYSFIPKIPIWVYFGGPWNGKCLEYFTVIWYIFGHLVYFKVILYNTPVWYVFPRKIWQHL